MRLVIVALILSSLVFCTRERPGRGVLARPAHVRRAGPGHIGTCDYVDLGPGLWPRIVEHLPDGAITVVEESGHAIWLDDPDGFEAAALRALAEIGGGGGE